MIKTIYENLNSGKIYGYMFTNCRYPFFDTVLYANDQYIYWSNYGSSATKNKIEKLQWLIETIFKTTPEEFAKKYECREMI